jgi:hypothetical protein
MTKELFDLEKALNDPAAMFDEPDDVINMSGISNKNKLKILEQWEHDARSLAVAEEEGMAGGEESMLGRVLNAIAKLGMNKRPKTSTKHG